VTIEPVEMNPDVLVGEGAAVDVGRGLGLEVGVVGVVIGVVGEALVSGDPVVTLVEQPATERTINKPARRLQTARVALPLSWPWAREV
jgi:hypothetical protein